jgi:hypothetical protein
MAQAVSRALMPSTRTFPHTPLSGFPVARRGGEGPCGSLRRLNCHAQLQPQRPHDFHDGPEFRIALHRQRFVEAFAAKACVARQLSHPLGSSYITQGGGKLGWVVLLRHRVQVGGYCLA